MEKGLVGGKHMNQKTGLSFDTTTVCSLARAKVPCEYCYVQSERDNKGWFAKGRILYDRYDGFVMRLRQDKIDKLNKTGGIRMFSFGDFLQTHHKDVERFLDDCLLRGLDAKAITKQVKFIEWYHAHGAIKVIHLSIDNLQGDVGRSPITHPLARRIRQTHRKVQIRAVVLNQDDLDYFGKQKWVDILTLNHGNNGFHWFKKEERQAAANLYPGRVCCVSKNCFDCEIRCGLEEVAKESLA